MYRLIIGVFGLLLVLPGAAFAYDDATTHPALTGLIVDFYNAAYGNPITAQERQWIMEGSVLEDTAPRWINHFYDPVRKVGWSGDRAGGLYASLVRTFSFLALSAEKPFAAIDWVNAPLIQQEYRFYEGDRTWSKALEYYADGNEEQAYKTLGYILHLLEDMSVPDHTRDDTHAPLKEVAGDEGSPYEEYLVKYDPRSIGALRIVEALTQKKAAPVAKQSIQDYLGSLAEYSNRYFFSKDTINDSKYQNPKIIKEDRDFAYGIDEESQEFPLVGIDLQRDQDAQSTSKEYKIKDRNLYYPILDAYFSRLSRQVVLHGAGAIALFEEKAKEAVVNKEYPMHIVKLDTAQFSVPIVSLVGTGSKIYGAIKSGIAAVGAAAKSALASAGGFLAGLLGGQNDFKEVADMPVEGDAADASNTETPAESMETAPSSEKRGDSHSDQNTRGRATAHTSQNANPIPVSPLPQPSVPLVGGAPHEAVSIDAPQVDMGNKNKNDGDIVSSRAYTIASHPTSTASSSVPSSERTPASAFRECAFATNQIPSHRDARINEVAWMGTRESASNEWMEIKNISGGRRSFENWQLIDRSGKLRAVIGSTTIDGNGFLLLERTDDSSVPAIPADVIYTGALSNSDEGLRLFDRECNLIDEVFANPDWPAGDNTTAAERKTMERNAFDLGWHTSRLAGGTPKAENSEPIIVQSQGGGGAASTPSGSASDTTHTSPDPTTPSSTPSSTPLLYASSSLGRVVISEIQAGAAGAADNEFVELYNAGDEAVSMTNWALKKKSASGSEYTLVSSGAFQGAIQPHGFFLIGHREYQGPREKDLAYSNNSNPLAYTHNGVALYNENGKIIDDAQWTELAPGQSIERKALKDGVCVSSQGDGEFLGNGCDTDAVSNFESRQTPNPQNSHNLPEPRSSPSLVPGFHVSYSSSAMELFFRWGASADSESATSTVVYDITEANASSTPLFHGTGTEGFRKSIREIGRDYQFSARAFDRDGLASSATTTTLTVPSFFTKLGFYKDPRRDDRYALEAYYEHSHFVPDIYQGGANSTWKLVAFYFNHDADAQEYIGESWKPDNADRLLWIEYPQCAGSTLFEPTLMVPDTTGQCGNSGGAYSIAMRAEELEDSHFIVSVADLSGNQNFDTANQNTNYVTAAFYGTASMMPSDGRVPYFQLAGVDRTRYYFGKVPNHAAPVFDDRVTLVFDKTASRLTIDWPAATDPDTLDRLLAYEIQLSTSTDWQRVGARTFTRNVAPGDQLTIRVRAIDDFGVSSTPSTPIEWAYPETQFVYKQRETDGWSRGFGQKDGAGIASFITESITPQGDFSFTKAVLKLRHADCPVGCDIANVRLRVYADNGANQPDRERELGSAILPAAGELAGDTESVFAFGAPVSFSAGTPYWFMLDVEVYGWPDGWDQWQRNVWRAATGAAGWYMKLGVEE